MKKTGGGGSRGQTAPTLPSASAAGAALPLTSPPDRSARARTRPGRLAAWDAWLVHRLQQRGAPMGEETGAPAAPRPAPFSVVDVGFGDSPATVLELGAALAQAGIAAEVTGLERDLVRVTAARQAAPLSRFLHGGFEALEVPGELDLIRVANVVRAYRAAEVDGIHAAVVAGLREGGMALEGSTDKEGHVGVFHVLERRGRRPFRERLVFHTDFTRGFAPTLWRDVLPRDFRRNLEPEGALTALFASWSRAFEAERGAGEASESFARIAARLASADPAVVADAWEASNGFLSWRPDGGVPTATPRQA